MNTLSKIMEEVCNSYIKQKETIILEYFKHIGVDIKSLKKGDLIIRDYYGKEEFYHNDFLFLTIHKDRPKKISDSFIVNFFYEPHYLKDGE